MVIYRNEKKDAWRTLFNADGFKRSDGTKVSGKELEDLLYEKGDGVVTERSFLTSTLAGAKVNGIVASRSFFTPISAKVRSDGFLTALPARDISFVCDVHNRLLSNEEVQNKLFADLISK
jgi:hypothetical protein